MIVLRFHTLQIVHLSSSLETFSPFFLYLKQENSDEEESEGKEPSWERQEAMVRRLQKKFPDQDKEVKTHRHPSQTVYNQHNMRAVLCVTEPMSL